MDPAHGRGRTPSALEIARALIRCRSVTPDDGGALPYLRDLLTEAGFRSRDRRLRVARARPDRQPLRPLRRGRAQFRLRRPYRRRAGRRRRRWRFDPFAARDRRRAALWPRRLRHEGRASPPRRRRLALRRQRSRSQGSISFLITGDEEGPAINGTVKLLDWALREGRAVRPLHRRRADHPRRARRHDQDRPARLAQRPDHRQRPPGPCRLSAARRQSDPRRWRLLLTRLLDPPLDEGNADFEPLEPRSHHGRCRQPGHQRHSRRGAARFNIRFNDLWTPELLAAEIEAGSRRREGRARDARLRADQRGRLPHQARRRSPIWSPPRSRT